MLLEGVIQKSRQLSQREYTAPRSRVASYVRTLNKLPFLGALAAKRVKPDSWHEHCSKTRGW